MIHTIDYFDVFVNLSIITVNRGWLVDWPIGELHFIVWMMPKTHSQDCQVVMTGWNGSTESSSRLDRQPWVKK
jgi:hypothetical protein